MLAVLGDLPAPHRLALRVNGSQCRFRGDPLELGPGQRNIPSTTHKPSS